MMSLLVMMMMIDLITIVAFGPHFISSSSSTTTHTGTQNQDVHEDQRLTQSVGLPSISNQLTLRHEPPVVLSSQVNAYNTIKALSSTIPDYEMQALKDLYNSTDGDYWVWTYYLSTGNGVHWDFTDDNANPCATDNTWSGLYCTYDSSSGIFHVTSIDLDYYQLHGTLSATLGQLSKLTSLSLSVNSLTGTLPASLGQLSELTILRLYYNILTGSIPSSLGQLSKLTDLDMHSNYYLTGTLPASLGQLSKLTNLWLYYNRLNGTLPASLGKLSELTSLEMSYNKLTGTIPSSFGNLCKLIYLGLYDNKLTGSIPSSLGQLSKLTYLSLYSNQLSGTIPSSLCKCHEMYYSLNENNFECYPTCMTSNHYDVRVDEDTSVCDGPSYNDICESSMSLIIVWIILPIAFVLLVAISVYLYYRYRNRCNSIDDSDRNSQYVDINQNNIIMDENNDNYNDAVNLDLSVSEQPRTLARIKDSSTLVGENGGSNEDHDQRRDNTSQVLEPVVRGELVSTVAGAVATDNEILNLPTAMAANVDDDDGLYVGVIV